MLLRTATLILATSQCQVQPQSIRATLGMLSRKTEMATCHQTQCCACRAASGVAALQHAEKRSPSKTSRTEPSTKVTRTSAWVRQSLPRARRRIPGEAHKPTARMKVATWSGGTPKKVRVTCTPLYDSSPSHNTMTHHPRRYELRVTPGSLLR